MTTTQPRHLLARTEFEPDSKAVVFGSTSFSWSQLESRARQLANGLIARGAGDGARWAILARNRAEWAEFSIGNARAGARYVPLNWHLTVPEIVDLLIDSESQFLVCDPDCEAAGREAVASLPGPIPILVLGEEYEAWLANQSDDPPADRPMGAPLQYTGGTTGQSKGVTRSDFAGNVEFFAKRWGGWGQLARMPEDGVMLLTTPLYHALGSAGLGAGLARGHQLVIASRFDPVGTLELIQDHQVTSTPMVPTQFIRLLKLSESERAKYDVSSLKWVLHTAAPCPAWAKREMIDWFGPVIIELYGSSEGTGPVIATSEEWLERPGTVGRAQGTLELSIVDDEGKDLPSGEIGTIYAKRSDGAPTYHGAPDKTAEGRLPDGRFTVGDVGWMDGDGFLFLADRRVDLILLGGSNVYPAEIEGVMSAHPSIADVAVFGIPDPDMGQSIKAVIEAVPGTTPDIADILTFVRGQLAGFKIPKSIDVVDQLPREASGKLKKRKLRDPYWT